MNTAPTASQSGIFGHMPDGTPVQKWQLDNGAGLTAEVIALGATITRLNVPDKHGKSTNILLGVDSVDAIFAPGGPYLGALIGRVGNRIRGARFTLDGKTYPLAPNAAPNHLHGGMIGYDKRLWHVTPIVSTEGAGIELTLTDPAGTEGYPGTVNVRVVYTLTTAGAWRIDYAATTDAPTPINLTQHAYFNLRDAGKTPIDEHEMEIFAQRMTVSDDALMPTGDIVPVADTVFDFRATKPIGKDLRSVGNVPVGYDNNYIIDGVPGTLRHAAQVYERHSGRVMNVFTTEPAMQFYCGNSLDGTLIGHDGFGYQQHAGFCLETQHNPDSPNIPAFPDTTLRPGKTYRSTTEYRFSVRP